jgi:hypothetical protein
LEVTRKKNYITGHVTNLSAVCFNVRDVKKRKGITHGHKKSRFEAIPLTIQQKYFCYWLDQAYKDSKLNGCTHGHIKHAASSGHSHRRYPHRPYASFHLSPRQAMDSVIWIWNG